MAERRAQKPLPACRHHAQPRAIVGDDNIRLIAVAFIGNYRTVFDIARIARLIGAGRLRSQRQAQQRQQKEEP